MFDLRPATMADADILFEWANDPVTRASSGSSKLSIPRDEHDRWMQMNVLYGYPKHVVMIADSEEGSVGVVRFDVVNSDVMTYRVSITVAPKFRGQQMSGSILTKACCLMHESTLLAEIKPENAASIKIFEGCGFNLVKTSPAFRHYRRDALS